MYWKGVFAAMQKTKQLNFIGFIVALAATFALLSSGCTKKADSTAPCSDASNVNHSECQKQITTVGGNSAPLGISFSDSYFYDQNTEIWQTIKATNLAGGIAGITIPIYANFLNMTDTNALELVASARTQFNNQAAYNPSDYNIVPYIELVPQSGAQFIYSYKKKDSAGNTIYEKIGTVPTKDGRPILPLINSYFDNQLYDTNAIVGTVFSHTLSFNLQVKGSASPQIYTIVFDTVFQIPNADFRIAYSTQMQNLTLANRFSSFFKVNDYVANNNVPFFTLKDKNTSPDQVPLDLKIVFKDPPTLTINEEVFFEMPFEYDTFQNTGKVVASRGYQYYFQPVQLDSTNDFKMKIFMNGSSMTANSAVEYQKLNLPSGTPWDIDFIYDFTQNQAYGPLNGDPFGHGLIYPFKPVCNEIANTSFAPLAEAAAKQTAINSGGYYSICHPTENKKIIINSNQMSPQPPYDLSDTFYGYFSYVPYNPSRNELGHLFGIKVIKFSMQGCMRVYAKQTTDTNWQIKSKSSANCGINPQDSQGWVYFYAEKQATVFDNLDQFNAVPNLKSILQSFSTRALLRTPNFYFNNELLNGNSVRHLY